MSSVQATAWAAFEAALDAWLVAPSEATEAELDRAWMHFHSV